MLYLFSYEDSELNDKDLIVYFTVKVLMRLEISPLKTLYQKITLLVTMEIIKKRFTITTHKTGLKKL